LGTVHFLSLDQQSVIHCMIICAIQLLTPNNLEVLRDLILQIDIYLLTYMNVFVFRSVTCVLVMTS